MEKLFKLIIQVCLLEFVSCQQQEVLNTLGDLAAFGGLTNDLLSGLASLTPSPQQASAMNALLGVDPPQTYYSCLLSGDSSGYSSWCGDNKDPSEEPNPNDLNEVNESIQKMLHEQAEKAFDPQTYIPLPVGPGTEQIVPLDPIKALNGAGNATNTQPPAQEKKIVEQIAPAAPSKGTANESEGLTNNEVKKGTEKEPKRSVDSDVRAHKLVPPLAHNSGLWESIRSGNEVDEVAWQGEADHLNIHPISSSSRMQQPQSTDVSAAEQRAQSHETSLPADSQSKRRHVSAMNRNALFHVPTVVAQFKPLVPVRRVSLTPFQKKLQQRRALFQMAVAHLKRFNRF